MLDLATFHAIVLSSDAHGPSSKVLIVEACPRGDNRSHAARPRPSHLEGSSTDVTLGHMTVASDLSPRASPSWPASRRGVGICRCCWAWVPFGLDRVGTRAARQGRPSVVVLVGLFADQWEVAAQHFGAIGNSEFFERASEMALHR